MLWIILLGVAVVCLIYNWIITPQRLWQKKNIPYLKPTFLFGNSLKNLLQMESFPDSLTKFYNTCSELNAKYIGVYSFITPIILIKDTELIKKITVKDFNHFTDHIQFLSEDSGDLFARSLFSLKGKEWKDMRNTLSPAFTSSKMKAMYPLISETSKQLTNYFLSEVKDKPLSVNTKDIFSRFTNDIIASATFGVQCDSLKDRENEFYRMGFEATDFSGLKGLKFFVGNISPKLMKIKLFSERVHNFFSNVVLDTMATREREGIFRPDMIHLLMEARKGILKNEDGEPEDNTTERKRDWTDVDITAQALLFFFAGFDTSSQLMCFIAYELAINPEIQERLLEEVDNAFLEGNGSISYEALFKMKYLDMVVCETLRKWPPGVLNDRLCVKPYMLEAAVDGYSEILLEKNAQIWIPTYCIHRDPKNFPDPERFDPERFNDENRKNIDSYIYTPFGFGPRICIGSRFALMETKALFVHLLSKFEIVVVDKSPIPFVYRTDMFNLMPKGGMWFGFKKRNV